MSAQSPHRNLPADALGWKQIVEPAKDAYWLARRNGSDETSALLAALDTAIALAGRGPIMSNVQPNVKKLLEEAHTDLPAVLKYAEAQRSAEADDFAFWAVEIMVGEHCDSGVNDSKYFLVDMDTGILIIEAAKKIIAKRLISSGERQNG